MSICAWTLGVGFFPFQKKKKEEKEDKAVGHVNF